MTANFKCDLFQICVIALCFVYFGDSLKLLHKRISTLKSTKRCNIKMKITTIQGSYKHQLQSIAKYSFAFSSIFPLKTMAYTLKSDELEVDVTSELLGLVLKEIKIKDNNVVIVQSIKDDADILIKQVVKPGMILINIGDVSVEGYTGKELVNVFKSMTKPTKLILRDPQLFFQKLDSTQLYQSTTTTTTTTTSNDIKVISTSDNKVLETTINFATNETLKIERLNLSDIPYCTQSAQLNDVVEVEYGLRQVSKYDPNKIGSFFGGTTSYYPLSTAEKTSFFLLGKPVTSAANIPIGFDIGIRGMCIGETRRVYLPPSLSYDVTKQFPINESGKLTTINKFQPLIVDVKLISINGTTTNTNNIIQNI